MDLIGNLISNIKVGILNKLKFISCTKSNEIIQILKVLQKETIILGFIIGKNKIKIYLNLKIKGITLIRTSKLNNRLYIKIKKLNLINQGAGFSLISTNKGILSDIQAKALNIGGELLCQLYWK